MAQSLLLSCPPIYFGPGDVFYPENSHVLPALIRRFHEAKMQNATEVVVWGSGAPRRELLYVDDMAGGCMHLMELPDEQISPELLSFLNLDLSTWVRVRMSLFSS